MGHFSSLPETGIAFADTEAPQQLGGPVSTTGPHVFYDHHSRGTALKELPNGVAVYLHGFPTLTLTYAGGPLVAG
jgi:hypothetical protein